LPWRLYDDRLLLEVLPDDGLVLRPNPESDDLPGSVEFVTGAGLRPLEQYVLEHGLGLRWQIVVDPVSDFVRGNIHAEIVSCQRA